VAWYTATPVRSGSTLSGLDRQVPLAGLAQLELGHADESVMDVHELRHVRLLTVSDGHDFSLGLRRLRYIGQLP
jgi:hypothetical protein